MKIVFHIISIRLSSLWNKENIQELIMLAFIGGLYFYAGQMQGQWIVKIDGEKLIAVKKYLFMEMAMAPVLAMFLPAFSVKKNMLPGYLPLQRHHFYAIDMIISMGRRPTIAGMLFLTGFFAGSQSWDFAFFGGCLLITLNAILITESITNIITWKKYRMLPFLIITGGLLFSIIDYGQISVLIKLLSYTGLLVSQFLISYFSFSVSSPVKGSWTFHAGAFLSKRNIYLYKEVLFNQSTAIVLLVGILIKLIVLFMLKPGVDLSKHALTDNPLQYLFFTPVFVFAYVFNNYFGFFRNLFFAVWFGPGGVKQYLVIYRKLLLPFLLADFIISFSFLLMKNIVSLKLFLFYVAGCLYGIAISLISSVIAVRKVNTENTISFKKNTSAISNLILIAPFFIILMGYNIFDYWIFQTCFAVLAWGAVLGLYQIYSNQWPGYILSRLK